MHFCAGHFDSSIVQLLMNCVCIFLQYHLVLRALNSDDLFSDWILGLLAGLPRSNNCFNTLQHKQLVSMTLLRWLIYIYIYI